MPTVNCSPLGPKPQIELAAGTPAVGYKLFFYVGGSVNTKQTTYTDSTGGVANTNPLVLNSLGQPSTEIWFTAGQGYKVVLAPSTDTDPPTSPVWSVDNLKGINDTTVTIDEWVSGPPPTFINATQFSMVGDQTSVFQVGRRIKATVTAGTVYGRITISAFAAVTTVTVVLDSGTLDSGLSAVQYGLLSATNNSMPAIIAAGSGITVTYPGGIPTITNLAITQQVMPITATVASSAMTLGYAGGIIEFRSATASSGTVTSLTVGSISTVISSGSTGGTTNGFPSRIWVAVINNAGTGELAWINTQLGGGQIAPIDESVLITTTAEGGAGAADSAGVWYSTTARTGVAFRIVGFIESTQATAGTWAAAASKIQGMGLAVRLPGQSIQTKRTSVTAMSTGSATSIPFDDTIPQNTEGDQWGSVSITPTNSINQLRIRSLWCGANNASAAIIGALFQDSTANALRAVPISSGLNSPIQLFVNHTMAAGTTSSTTFNARVGPSGASTTTTNGSAGARLMGGVLESYIEVEEIMS